MADPKDKLAAGLGAVLSKQLEGISGIEGLRRLSGGASQEIWAFDAVGERAPLPLILRRAHGEFQATADNSHAAKVTIQEEARLLRLAKDAGVPAPGVPYVLSDQDELGRGYIMDRLEGETIARKILRDDAFAEIRPKLARQCGEILAKIHAIPTDGLGNVPVSSLTDQITQYRATYDRGDYPHPVFELAFRTFSERTPEPVEPRLIHGDFRHGNLMIGPDGVRGVLDWELAHLGDPMEDLSWICVNTWRYGNIEFPVGGFGLREDLFEGYEAAGGTVDRERVRFWETFGSLKWGIMCMSMYSMFDTGVDRSVERATIGRRCSETELDLMYLLTKGKIEDA